MFALCDIVAEPSTFSEINISFINVADAVLVGINKTTLSVLILTSGKLVAVALLAAKFIVPVAFILPPIALLTTSDICLAVPPAYGKTRY